MPLYTVVGEAFTDLVFCNLKAWDTGRKGEHYGYRDTSSAKGTNLEKVRITTTRVYSIQRRQRVELRY